MFISQHVVSRQRVNICSPIATRCVWPCVIGGDCNERFMEFQVGKNSEEIQQNGEIQNHSHHVKVRETYVKTSFEKKNQSKAIRSNRKPVKPDEANFSWKRSINLYFLCWWSFRIVYAIDSVTMPVRPSRATDVPVPSFALLRVKENKNKSHQRTAQRLHRKTSARVNTKIGRVRR